MELQARLDAVSARLTDVTNKNRAQVKQLEQDLHFYQSRCKVLENNEAKLQFLETQVTLLQDSNYKLLDRIEKINSALEGYQDNRMTCLQQEVALYKIKEEHLLEANVIMKQELMRTEELRLMWQRRCDGLLDILLCDDCIADKDEAYAAGDGRNWYPQNCRVNHCGHVKHKLRNPLPEEDGRDANRFPVYADTPSYHTT